MTKNNELPTDPAIYRISYKRYGSHEQSKVFRNKGFALQFLEKITSEGSEYRELDELKVEYALISPWTECQDALARYAPASRRPKGSRPKTVYPEPLTKEQTAALRAKIAERRGRTDPDAGGATLSA